MHSIGNHLTNLLVNPTRHYLRISTVFCFYNTVAKPCILEILERTLQYDLIMIFSLSFTKSSLGSFRIFQDERGHMSTRRKPGRMDA